MTLLLCLFCVLGSIFTTVLVYRMGIYDGLTIAKKRQLPHSPFKNPDEKESELSEEYRKILNFNGATAKQERKN